MKKILTTISLLALVTMICFTVNAQEKGAIVIFTKTTHDFGKIVETDGPVTCSFEFVNNGDSPLVISNVIPSCGCTTPGWTKEPIAPGGRGTVQATYDPKGRVAPFDKGLTVLTNGKPDKVTLHIKGTVLPKPVDLNVAFPLNVGNVRLKSNSVTFGNVMNDALKTVVLETANATDTPVSFTFDKVPDYIKITAEPATLQPKQQGLIRVIFDATKKESFGFTKNQITLLSGTDKGTIDVTALVQENLPKATNNEATNLAPRVEINSRVFDFGTTAKGKSVTATYEITNEGKTDLIVRNITSDSPAVKSSVKNLKIKSGKTATLKFTYTPTNTGSVAAKAYIATNDPANTLFEVSVKGTVN